MPSHSRTTTSYGYRHKKIRARLLPQALGTMCPGDNIAGIPYRSPNCDGLMVDPARMHLAHTLARVLGGTDGDTINCAPCNLGAGAALGNQLRPPQPTGAIAERACNVCSQTYQPHHHKQRCCTPECRVIAEQRRDERKAGLRVRTPQPLTDRECTECGTTFTPNHGRRITCSTACGKARTKRLHNQPDRLEAARTYQRNHARDQATPCRSQSRQWA